MEERNRYQPAPQCTRSEARCRFHASAQLDSAKISIRESRRSTAASEIVHWDCAHLTARTEEYLIRIFPLPERPLRVPCPCQGYTSFTTPARNRVERAHHQHLLSAHCRRGKRPPSWIKKSLRSCKLKLPTTELVCWQISGPNELQANEL